MVSPVLKQSAAYGIDKYFSIRVVQTAFLQVETLKGEAWLVGCVVKALYTLCDFRLSRMNNEQRVRNAAICLVTALKRWSYVAQ